MRGCDRSAAHVVCDTDAFPPLCAPADNETSELKTEYSADGMKIESNWDQVVASFDDMNLKDDLLRGIYAYGFEKPSAIQQRGT